MLRVRLLVRLELNCYAGSIRLFLDSPLVNTELQLTWLIYLSSAVAISINKFLSEIKETDELVATLIARLFEALLVHDSRQVPFADQNE